MNSRQRLFFAIDDDLLPILEALEEEFEIEYVDMGRFEKQTWGRYNSYTQIPHLGFTDYGDWVGPDHHYIIKRRNSPLNVEEFRLTKGGVVFFIDQKLNPDTVELTPKGIYTKKQNVIVAGRTGTISKGPFASAIYKLLLSLLKKKFNRIGVFYVGPKAEEKLREGWRLVQSEKSPKEYDLAYPTE